MRPGGEARSEHKFWGEGLVRGLASHGTKELHVNEKRPVADERRRQRDVEHKPFRAERETRGEALDKSRNKVYTTQRRWLASV